MYAEIRIEARGGWGCCLLMVIRQLFRCALGNRREAIGNSLQRQIHTTLVLITRCAQVNGYWLSVIGCLLLVIG